MTDRSKTFRGCRTAIPFIPLSSLKVSILCTILCGLYGSPNEQNQMCELGTFPKSCHICKINMCMDSYL